MSYFDHNNIEDAQVISQTIRLPKDKYPKEVLSKIQNMTGDGYMSSLLNKSKYTIRGVLIGVIAGILVSMYFRKSKITGGLIGGGLGFGGGYLLTKFMDKEIKKAKITTETETKTASIKK